MSLLDALVQLKDLERRVGYLEERVITLEARIGARLKEEAEAREIQEEWGGGSAEAARMAYEEADAKD